MAACTGKDIAVEICEALGLDGNTVTGLEISMRANSIFTVTATFYPDIGVKNSLVEHFSKFKLVPITEKGE